MDFSLFQIASKLEPFALLYQDEWLLTFWNYASDLSLILSLITTINS